ncbi:MAG: hypothetical protein K8S55_01310, partial [Phycisphaerae bacterium]|nr:hypothetical protein [Phycisphaerae bacterium]
MKKHLLTIVPLLLLASVMLAAEPAIQTGSTSKSTDWPTIGVYLLADKKLAGPEARNLPLKKLIPAKTPLLTTKDIIFYDKKTCQLFIKLDTAERIGKAIKLRPPKDTFLIPVVVVVRNKPRVLGAFSLKDPV